jgi:hypothetical protein
MCREAVHRILISSFTLAPQFFRLHAEMIDDDLHVAAM